MTTIANQVNLTGNLGADVEVQQSGETTFAHFSVATNYSVPVGDGTYEKRTSWTRVTAFGGLARSLARLGKGSLVQVRAHLRQRVVEVGDRNIYTHDVIADEVLFLRFKEKADAAASQGEAPEGGACDTAAAAA